jgi:tetratricopeptide (TPR) repeat protein
MNATTFKLPKLWMWAAPSCVALLLASGVMADDLKDGKAALQGGRFDDAIRSFEKASNQGLAEGRAGVGQVWLKRHQYAKAMEAFQTAQKMDPNLALAYFGQGEALRQQDKCTDAVPLLQKAVDLDRRFPEAQLSLSGCLTQLKRFDEALASANRGLGWGSRWRPKFLVALGNLAATRDSLRDAAIWYTNAVQEAPDDPATHRALGDFYVSRGTFELAFPEFLAAVEKDSTDIDLHFALGRALDRSGSERANEALSEYRWVVAHDPEYSAGQLALGGLLYRAGKADPRRYAEAREPLEKYTTMEPTDGKGWGALGRTYYYLGMKDEALVALDKAEALGDTNKENFRVRARIWTDRKELEKANADYARGGEDMSPEDLMRVAQMLVIQGNVAKAESLYRTLIDVDSTSKMARFALGEVGKLKFRAKDYPTAIATFQRRIALDPENDEAYYYIGLSDKEMGKYPEALEALQKSATGAGATRPERHFWIGILQQQLKDDAAAAVEFQKAVDLDTTCGNQKALAMRQLGYFKLVGKQPADAAHLLEASVQCNAKDFQSWLWLGQSYQNSGNRAKATEAYKQVLELKPNQPEALKGLKSVQGGAKQGGAS